MSTTIILKHLIIIILLSSMVGLIITHYFEKGQTTILASIKKYIYSKNKINNIDKDSRIEYFTKYSFNDQPQINPVHVSQTVKKDVDKILNSHEQASLFDDWKNETSNINQKRIVETANFLMGYAIKSELNNQEYWKYPYNFEYPSYDKIIPAPWYSGMAQGLVIETLLVAYIITGEEKYLNAARYSANTLSVSIEDGGVAVYINGGKNGIWFEEYAHKEIEPPIVLNGHNFALIGLGRLAHYDSSYSELYNNGLLALKYYLPKFDVGVWSRYDMQKYMANQKYHFIHSLQLTELGLKNDDNFILNYAKKFKLQRLLPFGTIYRVVFFPHASLIIVLCANTLLAGLFFLVVRFLIMR